MEPIMRNIEVIVTICKEHRVSSLFVFGSVVTDSFQEGSDIDFIVDFSGVTLNEYADNYFSLKHALEKIFDRRIDLLEEKAITNPFLRQSIDATKQVVYEA
jgi:predicted nucleotidyltransferase